MAKKKKITNLKPKINQRMNVVTSDGGVRHIGTTVKYPRPVCGEETAYYGRHWTASRSPQKYQLPLCKKCINTVRKLTADLEADPTYTSPEERLQGGLTGLKALLEEYGEWTEEDEL